jgi:polyisoprenyl-teichoic acid--peptidoglycan teichoic acid transferase
LILMAILRTAFLFIPGLVLLSSCRSEAPILAEAITATPISLALASATPTAEILSEPPAPAPAVEQQLSAGTATPPLNPMTIPAATPVPWSGYPAPTTTPATAVPPPVTSINLPPEIEVMLLLGSDTTDLRRGRTDSIHLVFIHRQNGNASLVSIPRDLYVYQPGLTMDRINTTYLWGGFELLALTIEYNFGVRPTRWVLVHLDDFVRFIDDLGGIDVPVSDAFPDDCGGIPSGIVHMDGGVALCYVRERNTTSDVAWTA